MSLLDWIREVIVSAGYLGLGGLVLLENLFPPLPSELILPLAGFFVGTGDLLFLPAVLATTAGSTIGAAILYEVGRKGGRPLMRRRWVPFDEAQLERADRLIERHGWWVVLLGRLLPGVRSVVSLPAGLHRMPRGIFLVLTMIGSGVFNAALIGAGWALGSEWDRIQDPVSAASKVIVAAVVVALFCWLVIRARRRHVQAREDAAR